MSRIVEKEVYTFAELTSEAKEKARAWWRECENTDMDLLDRDDIGIVAAILGIEFDQKTVKLMNGSTRGEAEIWYSGFSSQGDGACFEGRYAYAKGSLKKLKAHAPKDEELQIIAKDLYEVQRKHFYKIEARMTHSGRYYHSGCMYVEAHMTDDRDPSQEVQDAMTQLMRDFADWIYDQLRKNYEWRMSDEQVDENILCNEYEFDEDGRRV